jgi:septal ring factor EnvC (AmiA/AmiB activator)
MNLNQTDIDKLKIEAQRAALIRGSVTLPPPVLLELLARLDGREEVASLERYLAEAQEEAGALRDELAEANQEISRLEDEISGLTDELEGLAA